MTTKIVIASTLKPISDPRAYEKIGKSLAATGTYEVVILGSVDNSVVATNKISFLPHPIANMNFIGRLMLPFKILRNAFKLRPEILIITTHELLIIGALLKLSTGLKLVYDIQENYNFNLRYQRIYPWVSGQ